MNSTTIISDSVTAIAQAPAPVWMKLLAFAGALWLFQTTFKTGVNIVYILAYIVGFFRWLYMKFKGVRDA